MVPFGLRPITEGLPPDFSTMPSIGRLSFAPVATIFENLEAGASLDDVRGWYEGLDRKQVQAVIEFAARSLDLTAAER